MKQSLFAYAPSAKVPTDYRFFIEERWRTSMAKKDLRAQMDAARAAAGLHRRRPGGSGGAREGDLPFGQLGEIVREGRREGGAETVANP